MRYGVTRFEAPFANELGLIPFTSIIMKDQMIKICILHSTRGAFKQKE